MSDTHIIFLMLMCIMVLLNVLIFSISGIKDILEKKK